MDIEKIGNYIETFTKSHIIDYESSRNEYRPNNGYGHFLKSKEVYSLIIRIIDELSTNFINLRIPEVYSSPSSLIDEINNFKYLLEKGNSLSKEIIENYQKEYTGINKEAPDPVLFLFELTNEINNAFTYALSLSNIKNEILNESLYSKLDLISNNFKKIAVSLSKRCRTNKTPFLIEDEYDVQDLFSSMLNIFFDDIRREENTPSLAGSSARVDIFLKNESCFIEIKKTSTKLTNNELKKQVVSDIADYKKHSECDYIYFFVYDPNSYIKNPKAFENDFTINNNIKLVIRP